MEKDTTTPDKSLRNRALGRMATVAIVLSGGAIAAEEIITAPQAPAPNPIVESVGQNTLTHESTGFHNEIVQTAQAHGAERAAQPEAATASDQPVLPEHTIIHVRYLERSSAWL